MCLSKKNYFGKSCPEGIEKAYLPAFLALSASSFALRARILEAVGPALATRPLAGVRDPTWSTLAVSLCALLALDLRGLSGLSGVFRIPVAG